MSSYYRTHEGDLQPGKIAKASDINAIQKNVSDAITEAVNDLTEGQSWILGTNDQSDKDAFLLTPDTKRGGRYVDQMILAEGDDADIVSIRQTSFRQPIKLSRSSVYSIIVKLQNKSEVPVPVVFELRDQDDVMLSKMRSTVTVPANTSTPTPFEVVFDLDYYPTAHGLSPEDLNNDSKELLNIDDADKEGGRDFEDSDDLASNTAGASVLYLYVEGLNINKQFAHDLNTEEKSGYKWNDTDPTFGIVVNKNSTNGQMLEEYTESGYINAKKGDLYLKTIYSNSPTYRCNVGQAIIGGEKVMLADTHVSIPGAPEYGNIISYVYMDQNGHLGVATSAPFLGEEAPVPDAPAPHLHIANITTYADSDTPIVEQSDETRVTRPRSHHERIRRLENKTEYISDVSIPPRLKYTLTGEDWIEKDPNDLPFQYINGTEAKKLDSLGKGEYAITTDSNGNLIVKLSEAEVINIPITLKSKGAGKVTTASKNRKVISSTDKEKELKDLEKNDARRAQIFEKISSLENDISKGTLQLKNSENASNMGVGTTAKEARLTKYNIWDDSKANRPATSDIKPIKREYVVTKGKNGSDDWASEFPAMTFYTSKTMKLNRIQIPIYEFKNCESIQVLLWKRQDSNNKKNTVWLEGEVARSAKINLSKKVKVKNGHQFLEKSMIVDFSKKGSKSKKGVTLKKGQYVFIIRITPKSGKGSVFVNTYKPKRSKDFCIRYYGAANASHFLLKQRYNEVWYNDLLIDAEEMNYETKGEVESGTVSWDTGEKIKTIKVVANITEPKGTKVEIRANTGGDWFTLENNKKTDVSGKGAGNLFKWSVVMKGKKDSTPVIKYNKKTKKALSFEITKAKPTIGDSSALEELDKNLCFTSKVFDANKILRDYIGDPNFAVDDNKFSNYEFVRLWAEDDDKKSLRVDIAGSDRNEVLKDVNGNDYLVDNSKVYYPVYSFHFVDLKLEDIPQVSVDYSNYDPNLEYDEHNLRMKIDTENSYNDDDIKVVKVSDFKIENKSYLSSSENATGLKINPSNIPASEENQVIAKLKLNNSIDLSKYSGLKVGMKVNGSQEGTLSGLAIYISSQNELEVPTNTPSEDVTTALPDGLPDLNSSTEQIIETYANKIVVDKVDVNGAAVDAYYKSIWDSKNEKWTWELLHDIKSYVIYELTGRDSKDKTIKAYPESDNKTQYFELNIDQQSVNIQNVKEIGLICLNDEKKYQVKDVSSIELLDFAAIKDDIYDAFRASDKNVFKEAIPSRSGITNVIECKPSGSLPGSYQTTVPKTSSIKILHQSILAEGEDLAYFDMTSKSTENFKHLGIQIACDSFVTKNMLELHLRKVDEKGNEVTVEKIQLPTMNYAYYPNESKDKVKLNNVVKKIKNEDRFDKIVLFATKRFKNYANKLKNGTELGDAITLYIGNITLYKAESFPLMHPSMRMKIYLDDVEEVKRDSVGIRKLGAVIQYR